ncbi:Allantoicase [Entomophthora muscae]|uniref:Allantoicase n=1 Tax=Entomophthora muscae TaxID=34485 RepID=A0ACC2SEZ1_9FUNG|nr:Allantoicase [Entomophthora muscae]
MLHIKRFIKGIFGESDGPAQYHMVDGHDEVRALTTNHVSLVSDIMLSEVLDGPELVENIIDCVGYEEGDGWVGTGRDWVVIRMGHNAKIHGFNINTARFRDNSATRVQIEACLENELGNEVWKKILDTQEIRPMSNNFFAYTRGQLVVYNKLRMNVIGGISTFKVYGRVINQIETQELINVAALANGGRVVFSSDNLVGHPERLLLQGPELAWSPGWIPATPEGPDHLVIALAKPAYIKKMVIDTHHTSATAHAAKIFCCYSNQDIPTTKWTRISSGLVLPSRNNRFDNFSPTLKISHIKFELSPATELNRIRIMGWFIDPANPTPPPTTSLKDDIVLSDESDDENDIPDSTPLFIEPTDINPLVESKHIKPLLEPKDIKPLLEPTEALDTNPIPPQRFSFQSRQAKRAPVSTDFTFQMVLPQVKRNR